MNKKHIGSNFDDFLREEKLLEAAETAAVKRVTAFQIKRESATDVITDVTDGASSATREAAKKSAAN